MNVPAFVSVALFLVVVFIGFVSCFFGRYFEKKSLMLNMTDQELKNQLDLYARLKKADEEFCNEFYECLQEEKKRRGI